MWIYMFVLAKLMTVSNIYSFNHTTFLSFVHKSDKIKFSSSFKEILAWLYTTLIFEAFWLVQNFNNSLRMFKNERSINSR